MVLSLGDFEGDWRVARTILHAAGPRARFDGRARFEADGAGLVCREAGALTIAGHAPVMAERRYLWRAGAGGAIDVLFDDGRPFHRIDLRQCAPQDRHMCDPDIYEVRYDFARWPAWSSLWRVRGPRKSYRMETLYRCAAGG